VHFLYLPKAKLGFDVKFYTVVLSLLCSLLFCQASYAFKISPIELTFDTKGRGSTQTIKVENTTKNKIPIEIFAFERKHYNGKEKRTSTNDFYFFPKQFILKPGEKRNIRISWMGIRAQGKNAKLNPMKKGKTNITQEKAYRLEVKQVPVNLKKRAAKTGITFLYNYVASLYVKPPKVSADIKPKSFRKVGKNLYMVQIQNVGSAHAILAYYNLVAKKNGKKAFMVPMKGQGGEVEGVNLLPGETRSVKIKVENKLDDVGLSLEFKKRS
jgi:P pilus assembly chaperone PapD